LINLFNKIKKGQVYSHDEIYLASKKGNKRVPIAFSVNPFMHNGVFKGLFLVIRDIKERIAYEKGLKKALKMAEESNAAKSHFLANMSHEIRTPMNGILASAELLFNTILNDRQKKYVDIILNSGESLLTIINDILDFSKIEAGKLSLENMAFNLKELLNDIFFLYNDMAEKKNIKLVLTYNTDIPTNIVADKNRLKQILSNLINNAIKFTKEGKVTLALAVESDIENKQWLQFIVSDTGVGIPENQQDKVFDSFYQTDSSNSRLYGGTGLGLTICKSLTEMMGGKISLVSQLNQGTTLSVIIPLVIASAKDETTKNYDILVLSNDKQFVDNLTAILGKWGLSAESFFKLYEMIDYIKSNKTNHFMDYYLFIDHLPEQSLYDIILGLKNDKNHYKLITCGNEDSEFSRRRIASLIDSHFIHYNFSKKISKSKLYNIFASILMNDSDRHSELWKQKFNANILVAEDNLVNQEIIKDILEIVGCKVVIVGNGQEVLDKVKNQAFDLIFMDCQMPGIDGYQATKEIRMYDKQTQKHHVIVALTAHAMEGSREKCLQAGMDDYVSKPFIAEHILIKLAQYLESTVPDETE
jgi:signal transduction histidine kinase/CheY-like chemotaxis protein